MMRQVILGMAAVALLSGCATTASSLRPVAPVEVKIIGLNDFHGNLEPPKQSVTAELPDGTRVRVPVGGAAYLASAIDKYRAQNPNHLVVSAGDLIGGTPFVSSLFLDEPTIGAMNRIGLDFNAVGNHEFDRGWRELLRMQNGGCEKYTVREPCAVEKAFPGAKFRFLAANVIDDKGETLLPATAIRSFGKGRQRVEVGLIGLTLKDTPTLASPSGLTGLEFREEADTVNALVPQLIARGADAIVVLIHQGLYTTGGANDPSCAGISGELRGVLDRLDPRIDVVVSGHTHWAYNCDYGQINASRPFLVTSAGLWGQYLTDINLTIDPVAGRVTAKRARNVMVQSESYSGNFGQVAVQPAFEQFAPRPDIASYVAQYVAAAAALRERPVGKVTIAVRKPPLAVNESQLGNMIADAQLAATRSAGAEFALMNNTGIRADLNLDGAGMVRFGTLFAIQPFANELKTMTLSGAEIKALLEQQLDGQSFFQTFSVSEGVSYTVDASRAPGDRVYDIMILGKPLDPARDYRLTMNSFLASGGDSFTVFRQGRNVVTGGLDLDALEAWITAVPERTPSPLGRVRNVTPTPPTPPVP